MTSSRDCSLIGEPPKIDGASSALAGEKMAAGREAA
jgi:hypothetical protein